MIQRRERLGFALKAREALRVLGERIGQDFDRHLAAEAGVGGAIDLAHAPFTDLRGDFVDAEAGAGRYLLTSRSSGVLAVFRGSEPRKVEGRCTRSVLVAVWWRFRET